LPAILSTLSVQNLPGSLRWRQFPLHYLVNFFCIFYLSVCPTAIFEAAGREFFG